MNRSVHSPPKAGAGAAASRKTARPAARKAAAPRTNDPERTMADILEVATREFAEKGLAGARIDVIAEAMRTSKRMIYSYFASKEGLYVAVLEEAYRRMRHIEADLHLDDLPPEDALRKLVGFTVDYQRANPDFTRLLMTEKIHCGEYLAQSKTIHQLNVPAIEGLRKVYERGVAAGVFRAELASALRSPRLHDSYAALPADAGVDAVYIPQRAQPGIGDGVGLLQASRGFAHCRDWRLRS